MSSDVLGAIWISDMKIYLLVHLLITFASNTLLRASTQTLDQKCSRSDGRELQMLYCALKKEDCATIIIFISQVQGLLILLKKKKRLLKDSYGLVLLLEEPVDLVT